MSRKRKQQSGSIMPLVLIGALVFGFQYKDKLSLPSGLNDILNVLNVTNPEATNAPSLKDVITDKNDALVVAGVLEGLAVKAEQGVKDGKIKTTIDLFNLGKDAQKFAFNGVSVASKYPKFVDVYDKYITTPQESTTVDASVLGNFTTQHRELAKSARNAAL